MDLVVCYLSLSETSHWLILKIMAFTGGVGDLFLRNGLSGGRYKTSRMAFLRNARKNENRGRREDAASMKDNVAGS